MIKSLFVAVCIITCCLGNELPTATNSTTDAPYLHPIDLAEKLR